MGLYQKNGQVSAGSGIKRLGFIGRLLVQWQRYLMARYHQARGRFVIFDRYSYDALLPPPQPLSWSKQWRRWLLAHACPAPDLVLVLDAPGEVLYARKGEHSIDSLEEQRQRYLQLKKHLPQMMVVDATRDAEQMRREVTSLIWRSHAR
jgi:thymidylate kinase